MNPDQTAPWELCKQYGLSNNINRREEQTTKLTWSNKDYGSDNESQNCDNNQEIYKCRLLFTSAAYIQFHLSLDFIIEVNTMNPDQEQSDLGPYCMQYGLSKNIRRRHKQTTCADDKTYLE